jgi:hypothetical protein
MLRAWSAPASSSSSYTLELMKDQKGDKMKDIRSIGYFPVHTFTSDVS